MFNLKSFTMSKFLNTKKKNCNTPAMKRLKKIQKEKRAREKREIKTLFLMKKRENELSRKLQNTEELAYSTT